MGGVRDPLIRRLLWPLLGLQVVVVYGVVGYMLLEGWSFVDALYMTTITLTTVGFREVRILDDAGKLFTVSLSILGVVLLLITITLVAVWVSEGNIGERRRRKRMLRQIERLKDHYIVCAFGRVGRTVAREFREEGVPFVVVDSNEALEERMVNEGVLYLIGDPSQEDVLRRTGIERARGLVCAVDSDSTNVFIALMARSINPDIFIVARASASESIPRLQNAGADRVISPYVTSGQQMALMSLRPGVVGMFGIEMRGEREVRLEEVQVEEGSHLAHASVADALGKATLLAIRHGDGTVTANPRSNQRLRPGDRLVLLGEEEVLRPLEEA